MPASARSRSPIRRDRDLPRRPSPAAARQMRRAVPAATSRARPAGRRPHDVLPGTAFAIYADPTPRTPSPRPPRTPSPRPPRSPSPPPLRSRSPPPPPPRSPPPRSRSPRSPRSPSPRSPRSPSPNAVGSALLRRLREYDAAAERRHYLKDGLWDLDGLRADLLAQEHRARLITTRRRRLPYDA